MTKDRQALHPLHTLCFIWLALLVATQASAASYRLDDSGTVVAQAVIPMHWRKPVPGRTVDHTIDGQVSVALRLNLLQWMWRSVRIYMVLAPADQTPLNVSWRTQGRLLPGAMRSGDRTLVYEGMVREPFLLETIVLTLTSDGRTLERAQSTQFNFELEVTP